MVAKTVWRIVACLVCVLWVAGCTTSNRHDGYIETEILPALVMHQQDPANSKAVESLLLQADQARVQGELYQAVRALERGLSLAPSSPWLHWRLADIRVELGQPKVAEGLALKALQLAYDDPQFKATLWQLVAACRMQQGKQKQADSARQKALEYLH